MHRIRLTVAYDGTDYCGWQVQPNGISVQKTLQNAIEDLVREPVALTGASRTDSGVHALGQVAVFDTDREIPPAKYAMALNQRLPGDIVVQKSEEVAQDFHPRYTNVRKTYEYRILGRRMPLPAERRYSWFVPAALDFDAMARAARLFEGEHDFRSFCSQKTDVRSTVRTIYRSELVRDGEIILYRVSGSGFLYNMVRILTGMLVMVGRGRRNAADIMKALEDPRPQAAAPVAPACGLTLVSVEYPDEEKNNKESEPKNN